MHHSTSARGYAADSASLTRSRPFLADLLLPAPPHACTIQYWSVSVLRRDTARNMLQWQRLGKLVQVPGSSL